MLSIVYAWFSCCIWPTLHIHINSSPIEDSYAQLFSATLTMFFDFEYNPVYKWLIVACFWCIVNVTVHVVVRKEDVKVFPKLEFSDNQ